jgi:eukaryotic-like serine/threonine-protein kinase
MDKVSEGRIGKYEIIRILGRGGMGEVLLAQDDVLSRRVAIKRPLKSAGEEGLARFEREARIAAALKHPNIPAVYDKGVYEDLPYIAMEFVEGDALDKIISSNHPMDLITKLRVIEQVCVGLNYAHQLRVIHRDIKPANIIVQPDGVAKIIDFGIAKEADSTKTNLTATSQVIGSLHYIAPERFKGMKIDGRSDLFSVGVMLFKLLTGTEPFTGGEATASYKIVNEAHSSLSAYLHDYPPALDEIIEKSLAKNPEDRYQTGEDFADALHEVVEHLKRSRVGELFSDAERLASESRFDPALELLDEAMRLDPDNTQVRKLRRIVRDRKQKIDRDQRFQDTVIKAEEALAAGRYEEAIAQFKEAQSIDSTSTDVHQKLQWAEERKRRQEFAARALAEAEAVKARGDITGALRILARAVQDDPENKKLQSAVETLSRQVETEANRARIAEFLTNARRQLATRDYAAAEASLTQAEAVDASNTEVDALRRELNRTREQEQRRAALEEIQARIAEYLRAENFDQAADLLNRALEKLPNEPILHRLQVEVETEGQKHRTRKLVDSTIAQCREIFAASPMEALAVLQEAMSRAPGDERLIAYERSLRKDLETVRSEQILSSTMANARNLLNARDYDKAASVLDSFQVEYGQNAEVDSLLSFARGEQARVARAIVVERTAAQGRSLLEEGRYDEALSVIEQGVQQTGDASLSVLLEQAREQQHALSRKIEATQRRVESLRQKGEYADAIKIMQEQIAAAPARPALRDQLKALEAERDQKQATAQAIAAAQAAAEQKDFAAALESIHAVTGAYGRTPELQAVAQEVEAQRSRHAQTAVEQSVKAAQAALLNKNPQAAMDSLKETTPLLPYVDEKNQTDWQRIAQSVKEALEKSGVTVDDQLAKLASSHRKLPIWAVAAGIFVVLAAVGVTVWQMMKPAPVAITQIEISKAPAGASVSIDDGAAQTVDPNGGLKVKVSPGPHKVTITANGFDPITDDPVAVDPGSTLQYTGKLSASIAAGVKTGTLLVNFATQPDMQKIRVFVDGANKGAFSAGSPIKLSVGDHSVQYKWNGYDDSPAKTITIAENGTATESVNLAKSAPKPTGSLSADKGVIEKGQSVTLSWSVNNADNKTNISINGVGQGLPTKGTKPVTPTSSTTYILTANGARISDWTVNLKDAPPPPPPPSVEYFNSNTDSIEVGKSVTLNWRVSNAPGGVTINGQSEPASGKQSFSPSSNTTYNLAVNGVTLQSIPVTVTTPPPPPPTPTPTPVATKVEPAQPTPPDAGTLERALGGYNSTFNVALAKKDKDCQAQLNGDFGGALKEDADWCALAKSITPSESGCIVGGSPDAPTLTCHVTKTVVPKDGPKSSTARQMTFHFAKSGDSYALKAISK